MTDHEKDTRHDLVKEATLRFGEKRHVWNSPYYVDSVSGAGCVCMCAIEISIGGTPTNTCVQRYVCRDTHVHTTWSDQESLYVRVSIISTSLS